MKRYSCLFASFASIFVNSISLANPKGGQVTAGQITITEGAGVTTINQTDTRGIIHWQDFSIGAGELTQFVQPSSSAAILNRVVGGVPSGIHGTLSANGHIYLINPNGILVGPTGVINTAGFVASTLDVPDAEFMAGGNMRFSGNSLAGVVNLGVITATEGDVILMGRSVENAGTINAPNGVVALAAGSDILMQAAGDERVVVNAGVAGGGNGVTNSGAINAAQAELKAAGGNVYALAVNNTGVIKATGIAQKNGRVILSASGGVVQNSGQISATSVTATPGEVRMDSGALGQTINSGTVDAAKIALTSAGGIVQNTGSVGGSSTSGTPAEVVMDSGAGGQTLNSGTVQSSNISLLSNGGLVNNAGMIAARNADGSGGHIILNAGPGGVVINGGIVDASSASDSKDGGVVEVLGGTITLTSTSQIKASGSSGGSVRVDSGANGQTINNGSITATATNGQKTGGNVQLSGGTVVLGGTSLIDVSGGSGGTILIGGVSPSTITPSSTSGASSGNTTTADGTIASTATQLTSAQRTTIEAGSRILANATNAGKGGNIVVWSDQKTVVNGIFEAKGGLLGGDGGLIETSGKKQLTILADTKIDATAPKGKGGKWLLDPEYDISIVAGGVGSNSNNSSTPAFTPTGNDSFIGADLIMAQLNAGTSVTIATADPLLAGAQPGNIAVTTNILKTAGTAATLTLDAAGIVDIQGVIAGTAPSNLSLNISAGGTVTGVNLAVAGGIGVDDLTILSKNGGSVNLNGIVETNTLSVDIPVVFPGPTFKGSVFIGNAANKIGTINGIVAQEGIVLRDSEGGLIINGDIQATQGFPPSPFNAILRTVGDFTINPGKSISANGTGDVFIEAKDGYFINNSASIFNQGLNVGSGWAIYSLSNATTAQGGRFVDGDLIAVQAPVVPGTNPIFNNSAFPAGLGTTVTPGTDITTKTFYFANADGNPGSGGGGGGGGGSVVVGTSRAEAALAIANVTPVAATKKNAIAAAFAALPPPPLTEEQLLAVALGLKPVQAELAQPKVRFSVMSAKLTVTPIPEPADPRTTRERQLDNLGDWLISGSSKRIHDLFWESSGKTYAGMMGAELSNQIQDWAKGQETANRPWAIIKPLGGPEPKIGTVLATDGREFGSNLTVVFSEGSKEGRVQVPEGGQVLYAGQGYYKVVDANGKWVAEGDIAAVLSEGTQNTLHPELKALATGNSAVAHVEADIGPVMVLSNGRQVVVAKGNYSPPTTEMKLVKMRNASGEWEWVSQPTLVIRPAGADPGFGKPLGAVQISEMARITGMSQNDINNIVAAGGGNMTPGVIAAIVAGGGGNLTQQQIAGIVAAGGGNLNPTAAMEIITAGIVAGGGGNIVAAGGGNVIGHNGNQIVAGGGLNFQMVANIVAASGGKLDGLEGKVASLLEAASKVVANDGAGVVANDGAGVMNIAAAIVAGGGLNLLGQDAASLLGQDAASLIGQDAGSLISNIASSLNMAQVATLIGNEGANLIGLGNSTLIGNEGANLIGLGNSTLVSNAGGTLVSNAGGTLVSNAGGTLVSNAGGTLVSNAGGTVLGHNGNQFTTQGVSTVKIDAPVSFQGGPMK